MKDILVALVVFLGLLALVTLLSGAIGAWLWPYSINAWCGFFDKPQTCTAWQGFGIGCIPVIWFGSIPIAVVTYIVSFFF